MTTQGRAPMARIAFSFSGCEHLEAGRDASRDHHRSSLARRAAIASAVL
jgi:uncharacterized ParB-like nuclease family protein